MHLHDYTVLSIIPSKLIKFYLEHSHGMLAIDMFSVGFYFTAARLIFSQLTSFGNLTLQPLRIPVGKQTIGFAMAFGILTVVSMCISVYIICHALCHCSVILLFLLTVPICQARPKGLCFCLRNLGLLSSVVLDTQLAVLLLAAIGGQMLPRCMGAVDGA